jgi:toxin ParE1/3/4
VKRRRVAWTEVARHDLEGIVSHASAESPRGALDLLARLEATAGTLAGSAGRGRVIPELGRLHLRQYRESVVGPFHLIHRLTSGTVLVLAVLDGRRSLEDILLERLVAFADAEEPH